MSSISPSIDRKVSRIPCLSSQQPQTIINVESYPETEEPVKLKESIISPRIKQNKKTTNHLFRASELLDNEKRPQFNEFLSKIEKFQKAKTEKILTLQAQKREEEELKILQIPKVKMNEYSKKLLENKKKRDEGPSELQNLSKYLPFTPSPQIKLAQNPKPTSSSSKALIAKQLFTDQSNLVSDSNRSVLKESLSNKRSEKVLANKFLKDFNTEVDDIAAGKSAMSIEQSRELLIRMFFMSRDYENLVKKEIDEKLFMKFLKIVGAEQTQEVTKENFRTFLMAVMNFFSQTPNSSEDSISFGKLIAGKLYLSVPEQLKIHKIFFPFYESRLSSLKKLSNHLKLKETHPPNTFKDLTRSSTKLLSDASSPKISLKPDRASSTSRFPRTKSAKRLEKNQPLDKSCKKPSGETEENCMNTSFRSARHKSRSQSRLAKRSRKSSVSEHDKFISPAAVSDPSLLEKAQDLLGQLCSMARKDVKTSPQLNEKAKVYNKPENPDVSSSKLIFQNKKKLQSVNNKKNIDDELRKVTQILKISKSPERSVKESSGYDNRQSIFASHSKSQRFNYK